MSFVNLTLFSAQCYAYDGNFFLYKQRISVLYRSIESSDWNVTRYHIFYE